MRKAFLTIYLLKDLYTIQLEKQAAKKFNVEPRKLLSNFPEYKINL